MQNRIRELRKQHKITMKQLGEVIGVAESTISQYETGKREPDNETLLRLGEYFGVSVDYLLGAAVQKETPPVLTKKDERKKKNVVRTIGRDGSYEERYLTDEQLEALKAVMRQMPKVEDDF